MTLINSYKEGYVMIVFYISILCFISIIYLIKNKNKLLIYFTIASIGQQCSELFRLIFYGFSMKNAPKWSCYVYTYTNFLTTGMEAYIVMLFIMHLWIIITRKKVLLGHRDRLSLIFGFVIPFILSLFSIIPQLVINSNSAIIPLAENCVTGYRQNAWQIILSGPGTVLPPFILSVLFSGYIAYTFYTESKHVVVRNIERFSTISFNCWTRMFLFGIVFGFLLVINTIGDFKNSINMIKNNTPEPNTDNLNIIYYIKAAMGIIVLIVFGTLHEEKKRKKINALPTYTTSENTYSNKNENKKKSWLNNSKLKKFISNKGTFDSITTKFQSNNNNLEPFPKNRFMDSFVEINNNDSSIIYGVNMLQLQELKSNNVLESDTTDLLNDKESNIESDVELDNRGETEPLGLKYYSLNENVDNYNKVLKMLKYRLYKLQNDDVITSNSDLLNENESNFGTNERGEDLPLDLKYFSLNENVDSYNKELKLLKQRLHELQSDESLTSNSELLNVESNRRSKISPIEINLYSLNRIDIDYNNEYECDYESQGNSSIESKQVIQNNSNSEEEQVIQNNSNSEGEQKIQSNSNTGNEQSIQVNNNPENVFEVQINVDGGYENYENGIQIIDNVENEQETRLLINNDENNENENGNGNNNSGEDDLTNKRDVDGENENKIPQNDINMKSKKEIIEEMISKLHETIVVMKDEKEP